MATSFPVSANTRSAVIDIERLIDALRKTGKEAGMSERDIKKMVERTKKAGAEGVKNVNAINQSMGGLHNTVSKVQNTLIAVFAVDRLLAFGRAVLNTTAEFQKLEAVLTNTLGSNSKARLALVEIARFAAVTPFAIQGLTQGFVKLANQGFVPVREEMRKLGDLASSTGKEFDMLVEAIIDAQTGEFERLKEFGIRASKAGDTVTFTFRDVKTQVDFTADSIREYILALGDAEGVSGSMAAISKTLAGQISNAGDNFDTFFNNLGKYNKGPIGEFFRLFNEGMSAINEAMTLANMTAGDLAEIPLKRFRDAFDEAKKEVEDSGQFSKLNQIFMDLTGAINSVNEDITESNEKLELWKKFNQEETEWYKKLTADLEIYNAELAGYHEIRDDVNKVIDEYNLKLEEQSTKANIAAAAERKLMREMIARQNAANFRAGAGLSMPSSGGIDGDAFMAAAFGKMMEEDRTEFQKQNAEEREEIWANEINHRALVEQIYYESSKDIASAYYEHRRTLIQEEMSLLETSRMRELQAAGENGEARDAINRKYAEKERQLRNKQARDQQAQAVFGMLVNQGPAIAKTIATLGYPAALPFITLVLAQFALQTRRTRSVDLPKFAEGGYDIDGAGTSTSDSILSWLSRGEDVVPADRNKKFGFLLKPIIENPALQVWDVKSLIDQRIPTEYAPVFRPSPVGDTKSLERGLSDIKNKIGELKQVHIHLDESGFNKWIAQGAKITKKVNRRHTM